MNPLLIIKKNPPPLLLLMSAILLFAVVFSQIVGINFRGIKMFDLPLDTVLWIITLFLILLGAFYQLTNKFLYSITITQLHVFITVFTTILILIVLFTGIIPSKEITENHEIIGSLIQILSLIFVFAQLIYLFNILLGLLAKRK
jgi:hypothetical protein